MQGVSGDLLLDLSFCIGMPGDRLFDPCFCTRIAGGLCFDLFFPAGDGGGAFVDPFSAELYRASADLRMFLAICGLLSNFRRFGGPAWSATSQRARNSRARRARHFRCTRALPVECSFHARAPARPTSGRIRPKFSRIPSPTVVGVSHILAESGKLLVAFSPSFQLWEQPKIGRTQTKLG